MWSTIKQSRIKRGQPVEETTLNGVDGRPPISRKFYEQQLRFPREEEIQPEDCIAKSFLTFLPGGLPYVPKICELP